MHSPRSMWTKLQREVAACQLEEAPHELVSAAEMIALPRTVRRYMRFFGVAAGTPKHRAMTLRWTGEFRRTPDEPWTPIEAVQRDTRSPVARIFLTRGRVKGVLPMFVHETYVDGHARVIAKLADIVPLVEASGSALSQNELVTWVDDCVRFAPSMLLGARARWLAVGDHAFDIVFTDCGQTVAARVYIDERGAPIDFETTDRFIDDPNDPAHPIKRGRWSAPVRAWQRVGEQILPKHGDATWELPHGDFTYARLDLDGSSVAFEV